MSGFADNARVGDAMPAAPAAWRVFLRRAGLNQIVCAVIAVVFWLATTHGRFLVTYGYSFLIGNACWALIDGARYLIARWRFGPGAGLRWPGWRWMTPVVVLGALLGITLGGAAGDALFGARTHGLFENQPTLVLSLMAAALATYVFYARETLRQQRVLAQNAERLAAETQLKLLQSQLEPHMLFNTLANLRVLIGTDPPRATQMLDHLIAFLRTTLASTRSAEHTLEAEFDAARDYLALMAMRMGPRLQVGLDLPAELRATPVPPLLLQPLIENALRHGLEPKVEGGRVALRARRDGDRLELVVRDTGLGPGAGGSDGTGFGLGQVRARLTATYGPAATLDVRPAGDDEGGTEARVLLPLGRPQAGRSAA